MRLHSSVPRTVTCTLGLPPVLLSRWLYSGSTEFRQTENKMTFPAILTNRAKNKTCQRSENMFSKRWFINRANSDSGVLYACQQDCEPTFQLIEQICSSDEDMRGNFSAEEEIGRSVRPCVCTVHSTCRLLLTCVVQEQDEGIFHLEPRTKDLVVFLGSRSSEYLCLYVRN